MQDGEGGPFRGGGGNARPGGRGGGGVSLTDHYAEGAFLLFTPINSFTRFLAITSFPPRGAFKGDAERHAQGHPEADVM